jgi:ABC-2 type transport system permease protein
MREIIALVRSSWQAERSYRLGMALSIASLAFMILPLYFVSNTLQPIMASSIASQSRQYFAFTLMGAMSVTLISSTISALPSAMAGAIQRGTLEAFLGSPVAPPLLFAGMSGYSILWALLRALVMLAAGAALGASISIGALPAIMLIVALIVLAHAGIGVMITALVVRFRTTGPTVTGIVTASVLLGGVYYPTHVIPSWLQLLSKALPLSYGLRALRRTALLGEPLTAVVSDVAVLALFAAVLLGVGALVLASALRYARRTGTLGQY